MKHTLLIVLALTTSALLLASCDLNQVVSIDTPVGPTPPPAPAVPTAAPGQNAGGGQIELPAARINLYAPGPNPNQNTAGVGGAVAGILLGIWHGIISPVTLILSFFYRNVQMYEVHNDGAPYNLGFLVGIAILFGILGFMRR